MPCFLPKITIFVSDHTDRNMKKAITIIFLTVLSVLNLSAAEIDSLFSRWEEATGMHRIRLGNELLSLGYDEGLVSEKKSYGRNQSIESEARIYDMMSYYFYINDKFDDALSTALIALPLCEKSGDELLLGDCINNIGIFYQRKGLFGQAIT